MIVEIFDYVLVLTYPILCSHYLPEILQEETRFLNLQKIDPPPTTLSPVFKQF